MRALLADIRHHFVARIGTDVDDAHFARVGQLERPHDGRHADDEGTGVGPLDAQDDDLARLRHLEDFDRILLGRRRRILRLDEDDRAIRRGYQRRYAVVLPLPEYLGGRRRQWSIAWLLLTLL